ncbi:MAG TPA: biopolymer transporter ExbD [Blastocatellia bacterium]|nr:biopolymer transporter ExbD [Blastocatellia bacterium]
MAHGEVDEVPTKHGIGLAAPNINVTPLVDVLLVLLIIFFVIQPQKEAKFESQIPQKPQETENAVQPPTDLLMVDVKSGSGLEQSVELNSKPMSLVELGDTLKSLLEQRPDKAVFLKAPKDKSYGDIVTVIDVMKGAGAQPIGLQIDFLQE